MLAPLPSVASSTKGLLFSRLAFIGSGAVALGTSGILFRDLTDFSQWVKKPSRNDVWRTFRQRDELMQACVGSLGINTLSFVAVKPRPFPFVAWAGLTASSLTLLFLGYANNELMFRARNKDAVFVSTCEASKILKPTETVIVTQLEKDQEPVCFPDSQITRPHVARVGVKKDGTPAAIAYCGLTGTGIVYETPDLPDGTPREFIALTQLENNLILMDRATGHIGHQINGLDETKLLEAMGGEEDYDRVGRRPSKNDLTALHIKPATEVATWRMSLGKFTSSFPHGKVFINDYKEFKEITRPVKSIYDMAVDLIFYVFVDLYHNRSDTAPLFSTIDHIDDRLPAKVRVWGFNVEDSYVALTQDFVQQGRNGTRNMTVGGIPLVASYDPVAESLGVWIRPSVKPIHSNVNVYGMIEGSKDDQPLHRLSTVKNGLFWFAWQNFFPQCAVNPEK